jgi:hypothetical protein
MRVRMCVGVSFMSIHFVPFIDRHVIIMTVIIEIIVNMNNKTHCPSPASTTSTIRLLIVIWYGGGSWPGIFARSRSSRSCCEYLFVSAISSLQRGMSPLAYI